MVAVPSAVILVNNDLVPQVRQFLVTQLHIDEVIDGYVFDNRIAADGYYIENSVKSLNRRLMVVRDFREEENRALFDVVIFIKNGLASISKNNFGPPGGTFQVLKLHWGELCIFDTTFNYRAPTGYYPGGCWDSENALFKNYYGTWQCDVSPIGNPTACYPIDQTLEKRCCRGCGFPYGSPRALKHPKFDPNGCRNCGSCCSCCNC